TRSAGWRIEPCWPARARQPYRAPSAQLQDRARSAQLQASAARIAPPRSKPDAKAGLVKSESRTAPGAPAGERLGANACQRLRQSLRWLALEQARQVPRIERRAYFHVVVEVDEHVAGLPTSQRRST